MNALRRALRRVIWTDADCWEWQGAKTNGGYGVMRTDDKRVRVAHRVIYEHVVGQVPADMDLDHLCRVRACCNPVHLEAITRQQNVDRGLIGRKGGRCLRGHEPDWLMRKNGYRDCRTCTNERNRARYHERKAGLR